MERHKDDCCIEYDEPWLEEDSYAAYIDDVIQSKEDVIQFINTRNTTGEHDV